MSRGLAGRTRKFWYFRIFVSDPPVLPSNLPESQPGALTLLLTGPKDDVRGELRQVEFE